MYKNIISTILIGYIASITLGICPLQLSKNGGMEGMNHGAADSKTSLHTVAMDSNHQAPSCDNCLGTSSDDASSYSGVASAKQATTNVYTANLPINIVQPLLNSMGNIFSYNIEERPPPNGPAMVGVVVLRT